MRVVTGSGFDKISTMNKGGRSFSKVARDPLWVWRRGRSQCWPKSRGLNLCREGDVDHREDKSHKGNCGSMN